MTSQSEICLCSDTTKALSAYGLLLVLILAGTTNIRHTQQKHFLQSGHVQNQHTTNWCMLCILKGKGGTNIFSYSCNYGPTGETNNLVTAYTVSDLPEQPNFETYFSMVKMRLILCS